MAKILVVDDEPDMVEMIKAALESAHHQVLAAYNGQEGIDKAKKERPDAIILDIMMPVKDGFAACKEIKEDPLLKQIPILVLHRRKRAFCPHQVCQKYGFRVRCRRLY